MLLPNHCSPVIPAKAGTQASPTIDFRRGTDAWVKVSRSGRSQTGAASAFAKHFLIILGLLLLAMHPLTILAHGGGTPQLVKEPAGAYAVYVWTNPDPLRVGTMHVTVALVEPDTDVPVLNAAVQITATPQTGQPLTVAATHENATIKTYYEADMELSETGPLQVTVAYQDSAASGSTGFAAQVVEAGINTVAIGLGVALLVIGGGVVWMLMGRRKRPAAGEQ